MYKERTIRILEVLDEQIVAYAEEQNLPIDQAFTLLLLAGLTRESQAGVAPDYVAPSGGGL